MSSASFDAWGWQLTRWAAARKDVVYGITLRQRMCNSACMRTTVEQKLHQVQSERNMECNLFALKLPIRRIFSAQNMLFNQLMKPHDSDPQDQKLYGNSHCVAAPGRMRQAGRLNRAKVHLEVRMLGDHLPNF